MVKSFFYSILLTIKQYNPKIKFIISGDFYQLPPVNDSFTGNYEKSRALFELVDGNKLLLSKCRRSSDVLFKICESVKNGKIVDKAVFGKIKTMKNLSYTNKTRMIINKVCNERFIQQHKKQYFLVKKLSYDDNSQDMKIVKGVPLIARVNNKQIDIVNNETFEVENVDANTCVVKNEFKTINIDTEKLSRFFNMAFCISIHKSQGETYDENYTIYEWNKLDKHLKYVALSRSRDLKYINVV